MQCDWAGSAWQDESTFHQLAPYIGKAKSSMAASLVRQFSREGDIVLDPFSGCGTFAFEAWAARRHVIANDLSPYADLLTRAKLFPYGALADAQRDIDELTSVTAHESEDVDLRRVPSWVRQFFHPQTLRDAIGWAKVLKRRRKWFLLSCLLGILHHQRPGFLSYPSSHTVPYLRTRKFPPTEFPALYEYRPVLERLTAKVKRAFRRVPTLDFSLRRDCYSKRAESLIVGEQVGTIITSPPYMRQLDYARDNRLRLWFLGCDDWRSLDTIVSPREAEFLKLMKTCFRRWRTLLKPNGHCVLVIGDACSRLDQRNLPDVVVDIALETGGYLVTAQHNDAIPNERRVRRGIVGSASEIIIVLRHVR